MSSNKRLTVLILAKNEELIIKDCLRNLDFADSIILGVDTTTTDNTKKAARDAGDTRLKVIDIDLVHGFGYAKNQLIDASDTEWCLFVDADEAPSTKLQHEIVEIVQGRQDKPVAYNIQFETILLGKAMHYGGWREEHIRLIMPSHCRYSEKKVHEELIINGPAGQLKGKMVHRSHRTIAELIVKINLYSSLEAEMIAQRYDKPITSRKLFYEGMRQFLARFIKRSGWRDGTEGLIEAASQAYSIFIQWAKAWEIQKKRSRK